MSGLEEAPEHIDLEDAVRDRAETQILAELDRRLHGRVDPVVVDHLTREGDVAHALARVAEHGLDTVVTELLARYKQAISLKDRDREPPMPREAGQSGRRDVRGEALSQIFAYDASNDPGVIAYREGWLRGAAIEREEVGAWMRMRRAIPLRDPNAPRPTQVETIGYLVPGSASSEHVIVPATGPLAELKALAASLSMRYGWIEAEAVTFVLTGVTPWLPAIRATIRQRMPWTSASKIELEISPRATPAEVAELYRKARAGVIGWERRRRDLQRPERAELAVFAFERADGRSWRSIMDEWNEQASTTYRRYADVRSYARDARSAFRAITGTELS